MTTNGNGEYEDDLPLGIDPVARAKADAAVNHALSTVEAIGVLTREMVGLRAGVTQSIDNLSDKVDAAISDIREARREVRSMRPKVDSFSDADERLSDLEREIKRRKHAEAQSAKLRRRLVMAVLLGALTAIGGSIGTWAVLKAGMPVPAEHGR